MRRLCTLLALVSFLPGAAGAAEPLQIDPKRDAAILLLSGAAAGGLGLFAARLTPDACRFCAPNAFDAGARLSLRWDEPGRAALASDLLANGLLPAAVLAHSALMAWGDGGAPQLGEDLLAISQAVLVSTDLNLVAKESAGRLRPSA